LLCFGYSLVLGKNSPFLQITANNQIPVLVTRKKSRLTMTCANPIMQMGFALNIENMDPITRMGIANAYFDSPYIKYYYHFEATRNNKLT
jgi:hypothetical protein